MFQDNIVSIRCEKIICGGKVVPEESLLQEVALFKKAHRRIEREGI
jgi:hypothetical protein